MKLWEFGIGKNNLSCKIAKSSISVIWIGLGYSKRRSHMFQTWVCMNELK